MHTAQIKNNFLHLQYRTLHMEVCSMLCVSPDKSGVWGRMNACICMAEFLCCPPETIPTLLISMRAHYVASVVSDSLQPHGLGLPGSSARGDSPGKNTASLVSRALADRFFATSTDWELFNQLCCLCGA